MRVLIATSGASHEGAALRFGAQIARRAGGTPTLLTVIRYEADRPPAPVDEILDHARELLRPECPDVRTRVRIGHPAVEIVCEAEEGGYDLVMVAERQNRQYMTRFLPGSTAVRVVEHAPCPVLVAKGKAGPLQRILLCDSGADDPSTGLAPTWPTPRSSVLSRFAAKMADLLEGEEEITLLHVMSQVSAGPGVNGKQLRASAGELIEEQVPEGELLACDVQALERLGIHARARVRHGLVVDEILAEAEGGDYDLVVIGAYRAEGWQRILLSDLAHKIMVQLDRPVLVVR